MRSNKSFRRRFSSGTKLIAVSTGLVGCLMMVLAFSYIITTGQVVFVEPNSIMSHLELLIFVIGGLANAAAAIRLISE